jgi:hypothetical protein
MSAHAPDLFRHPCEWPVLPGGTCGAPSPFLILAPTNDGMRETRVCRYHRDAWRAIRRVIYGSDAGGPVKVVS